MNNRDYILATVIFSLMFFGAVHAKAQTEYKLLAPIPLSDPTGIPDEKTSTATYLQGLFKLILAAATALAVVRLIYAGVKYMSTDAFNDKNEAKGIIEETLWGLLLAIGAWLIVNTINPKLVKFDLELERIPITLNTLGVGSGSGIPMTPEQIIADTNVRNRLKSAGVETNAGPCTLGQGYGCTNLNGLPEGAIQALVTLKKDCRCGVTITGGTEPGPHQTHGEGKSIVDLSDDTSLRNWLSTKGFLINNGTGAVVKLSSGRQIAFNFERTGQGNSTGNHWHIVM